VLFAREESASKDSYGETECSFAIEVVCLTLMPRESEEKANPLWVCEQIRAEIIKTILTAPWGALRGFVRLEYTGGDVNYPAADDQSFGVSTMYRMTYWHQTDNPYLLPGQIDDPGDTKTITATESGIVLMVAEGDETRILAGPAFNGQRLTLMLLDGGDIDVVYGTTTYGFDAAGRYVVLEAVSGEWLVKEHNNVTITETEE
jgi:hypothetical protein